jgi:hypothetical protein
VFGGAGFAQGGAVGFAGGGAVHGPGTSTSDSIPARLSVGEYVSPAKSVSRYGVDLYEALRRGMVSVQAARSLLSGIDLSGLAERFSAPLIPGGTRHYANGGLATAGAPAASASLQPVHFHIAGPEFPVMADKEVVNAMQRVAIRGRLLAGGRKPRWYGV